MDFSIIEGKKVLLTGNTGFKGSWMTCLLKKMGAKIYGYSLDYPSEPCLFKLAQLQTISMTKQGNVADYKSLFAFFKEIEPDVVIHMAAQPLVREGYRSLRPKEKLNCR